MSTIEALRAIRASIEAGDFSPEFQDGPNCGCFFYHEEKAAPSGYAFRSIHRTLRMRYGQPLPSEMGEFSQEYLIRNGVVSKEVALSILDDAISEASS